MPGMSQTLGMIGAASGVASGLKGASKKPVKDVLKKTIGKGVAGLAVGSAAGAGLDLLDRKSKETPYHDYVRAKMALEAMTELEKFAVDLRSKVELIRQSLADKAIANAAKKKENFLTPIKCEVCSYEGTPTNKGLCPQCGAIGGIKVSERDPNINFYGPNSDLPRDGISVYDADVMGRKEFPW